MLARAHEMIQHFPQGYDTGSATAAFGYPGTPSARRARARCLAARASSFSMSQTPISTRLEKTALSEAISELKQAGALVIVGHRPLHLSAANKIPVSRKATSPCSGSGRRC